MVHRDDPIVDRLIVRYWRQQKTILVILAYLRLMHHVVVGLTWLKKRLAALGLKRRNVVETRLTLVHQAIKSELQTSNCCLGYRAMWRLLQLKYRYTIKRSTVMMLLAVMDPIASRLRKVKRLTRRTYVNKGPNWCWHIDGYDKLKPFGFPIHACIDGFSRKIIWLELTATNNDPDVVVKFYLDAVVKLEGCPTLVRSDCGTENVSIATCQMALRHKHDDQFAGDNSFIFGSSVRNTRIESWWSRLRSFRSDWWIDLFKTLVAEGYYNPDVPLLRHVAAYIFAPLLRKELCEFKNRWNLHRIRRNRFAVCPCDVPNDVYYLSSHLGTGNNYRKSIDVDLLAHCIVKYTDDVPSFYPREFQVLADNIMSLINFSQDQITPVNCKFLYCYLAFVFLNVI